jgi:hypothetical protein
LVAPSLPGTQFVCRVATIEGRRRPPSADPADHEDLLLAEAP